MTSFATAEKRLKVAQRRCRRRYKAFKDVIGGTKAPNIAHLARRKLVREIAPKLQFSATMDPEAMPTNRADVSASLPKRPTKVQMLQTEETGPLQTTTTEHIAQNNDKPQDRGDLDVSSEKSRYFSDIATASSSQTRQRSSQLLLGPKNLGILIERLPIWAHWCKPPLSAAQVEHMRKRMRLPEEYLSMGLTQRNKAVADDLSAALRSMCQTFKRSLEVHREHAGKLTQEFLRRGGDDVGGSKKAPGAELNVEKQATVSVIHRLIPANSAYAADSSLSENTGGSDHPSRKRRKITRPSSRQIHLDHQEDSIESSPGVAQIPRRDESHPTTSLQTTEELLKLMGKRKNRSNEKEGLQRYTYLRSSTLPTGGSVKPGLPNKTKTENPPESMSDRHQDSQRDGEKKGPDVNIPAALKMATDLRPYSQWPGTYESDSVVKQGLTVMSR